VRHLPPLNALRAFEAAARHLSFHRAADELHVTPSAVSHQIKSLEDHLGVRLFRRLTRQVAMTHEGQEYLRPVRTALDQIDAATQRILGLRGGLSLTLSVSPTFATEWLVPHLSGFQTEYPDIEVRLVTNREVPDFSRSDADVAMPYGTGDWPGLVAHLLLTEELVPVCSPALLEGEAKLERPEDLRRATLIHVLPRIDQWRNWLRAAGVDGVDAERGPKFQYTSLALEAAMSGLGVVVANRILVAPHLEAGRLAVPFDVDLPSTRGYYLVYPEDRANQPKVVAFREWLLALLPAGQATGIEAMGGAG